MLIADEPVSALDASVQAQILSLFADLRSRMGLAILLVTHDLRAAAQLSDRIAVMKAGRIVEIGETGEIFRSPRHPYTRALMAHLTRRSLAC